MRKRCLDVSPFLSHPARATAGGCRHLVCFAPTQPSVGPEAAALTVSKWGEGAPAWDPALEFPGTLPWGSAQTPLCARLGHVG